MTLVESRRDVNRSGWHGHRNRCRSHSNGSIDIDAKPRRLNSREPWLSLLLLALAACQPTSTAGAQTPQAPQPENLQEQITRAVAKVEPAVVAVAVFRQRPEEITLADEDLFTGVISGQGPLPIELGSGIVIEADASPRSPPALLVLTTADLLLPVVAASPEEKVLLTVRTGDGTTSPAEIVAADPVINLAILRISGFPEPRPLQLRVQEKVPAQAQKGQLVLAFGNPAALVRTGSGSVDLGVVSNVVPGPRPSFDRHQPPTLSLPGGFLAVNAKGLSGSSGEPIVDLDARLLAITKSLVTDPLNAPGSMLAIPCTGRYGRIIESLRKGHEVDYGWLGVTVQQASSAALRKIPNADTRFGVEVTEIRRGSPAERAPLELKDIIVAIDAAPVRDVTGFYGQIALFEPGAEIQLIVYRPSQARAFPLKVTLGKWPVEEDLLRVASSPRDPPLRGLQVDWPTSRARFLSSDPAVPVPAAVVIMEIEPNSPAAAVGLKVGDFIAKVGERPIATPKEFHSAVESWPDLVPVTIAGGSEVMIGKP